MLLLGAIGTKSAECVRIQLNKKECDEQHDNDPSSIMLGDSGTQNKLRRNSLPELSVELDLGYQTAMGKEEEFETIAKEHKEDDVHL